MIVIREGRQNDVPKIFELIKELAEVEGGAAEITNTAEQMQRDGFGEKPAYGAYVAERSGIIVGAAIYYFRYSTWKGKRIYLEDIIVTRAARGNGVGAMLFERVMAKSQEEDCVGMAWQVSEGNEGANGFYQKYGPRFESQWVNCSLNQQQLTKLLSEL